MTTPNTFEPAPGRRAQTKNRVFQYIYYAKEPVTQQQLAYELGLSLPTVHQNIAELEEEGLLLKVTGIKSTGGRPPVGYTVSSGQFLTIGVKLSASQIRFLALDLKRNEVADQRIAQHEQDGESLIRTLTKGLADFIKDNRLDSRKILGVGITIPGAIDKNREKVLVSPSMHIRDFRLQSLQDAVPYPCYVENDAASAGYAELLFETADGRKGDFAYLLLEYGVGGALILDGRQYKGTNGRSGEFGHMCVHPGGLLCNCGRRGCLEAYCGALRYTRDIGRTSDEFFESLRRGNADSVSLWNDILQHLAVGIANLRMAFDCDIVLGGATSLQLEPYLTELRRLVAERDPFSDGADYVRLGREPEKAGMIGAAGYFITEFIKSV